MLLRIIDKPAPDKQNHLIEIIFNESGQSKSFVTQYYNASFPESLKKDIAWYFKDYLNQVPVAGNDKSVIDRLLSHGKYMGDRLVGDDLQLMSYREVIEDRGYSALSVSIESSRISFFEEPWEALVLPDSEYILSSVANSFIRRFNNDFPGDSTAGRSDSVIEFDLTKESPLKILHAVYVPEFMAATNASSSTTYASANQQLRYDGVIDYELWPLNDWRAVKARLSNASAPIHIFRYDGPLVYRQSMFYLPESPGGDDLSDKPDQVSLLELIEGLKAVNCGLLILNVAEWLCDSPQPLAADTGLALAAQISISAGMPNVLGLSNVTDVWTADNCLNHVYENILKRLSLAQSVVEARKALQTQTESDFLSFPPLPFQSWPLLVHYELKPVMFCVSAQPAVNILHTQAYADIRRKMHGFSSEFLPPHLHISGDSVFLDCLMACRSESGVVIHIPGGQGVGKTQLLHMLAFYLMRGSWQQAFYFDYAEYFYTVGNIQEMIAPVLSARDDKERQGDIKDRYIFMLDNFDASRRQAKGGDDSEYAELGQYLNELTASRHIMVIASYDPHLSFPKECSVQAIQIELRPLNPVEQRNMTSQLFKNQSIDVKEYYEPISALLECCRGNPFLIKHIMPKFVAPSHDKFIAQVESLFSGENLNRCVDIFYSWQWQDLNLTWRRWLILLTNLRGVILEMLAVVCDSKTQFEPVIELFDIIGKSDTTFSEGIAVMGKAGFTVQYPLGKMINPRCIPYIQRQAGDDDVISSHRNALSELLSRIVCKSLATVIPEALKKSDQVIIQNLISNRWQWAKHLESVWKTGEYDEFSITLSSLTELLRQARLAEELAQWALRLLSENNEIDFNAALVSPGFLQGWMKLVLLASGTENAVQNKVIKKTAVFCDQWIKAVAREQVEQLAALFASVVQFLQMYYREIREWDSLQNICEIALREYRQHEVWPLAVPTLNLLIECCSANGEIARAQMYERQLLNDIPLDRFPAGFKWQLQTKVITNRLVRGEFNAAQELLYQMGTLAETDYQRRLLDMLQADIYYRQEKLEDAALLYRTLMKSEAGETNTANREFFKQRYAEIEGKLEAEKLAQIARSSGPNTC